MRYIFGSLILPSHISNWQANKLLDNDMSTTFWRRFVNFYEVKSIYKWANIHILIENALAKEYLGKDLLRIDDITRNMSIYLVNKHPVLSYARPEQLNIIFYYGFHIAKVPPALPKVHYTYIYISNAFK